MADVPERFAVRAMHQDQVIKLPPGATLLARSAQCDYAALAYGDPDRPGAISLQPHPEFGADFMDELIAARAGTVIPAEQAAAARASLGRPVQDQAWARLIVGFLRQAQASRAAA
jgi:GMP synthase (glutamine-hydrolysing)